MADYPISKEAVARELINLRDRLGGPFAKEVLNMALTRLQGFPQRDGDNRWISVEERLPEDNQNVIAFVQHPISGHHWLQIAHMLRAMGMDECQDDEWWIDSTGEVVYYITHWMPLPEPPKEDLS